MFSYLISIYSRFSVSVFVVLWGVNILRGKQSLPKDCGAREESARRDQDYQVEWQNEKLELSVLKPGLSMHTPGYLI